MKNRMLYLGGALVALLLLGLLWFVRSGGRGGTSSASVTAPETAPGPAVVAPPRPVAPVPTSSSAPDATPAAPNTTSAPAERTDANGNIVHDHSGETPAARSPITGDTVFALRKTLEPLVKSCGASLAQKGTPAASITLVAKVSIAGGQMSASPVQVSHKGFTDEGFDACVTKALAEVAMAAPAGQPDASYKVAWPFTF
jgi:hypothetical protein